MSHVLRAKIDTLEDKLQAERQAHRKTQEAHADASSAWQRADDELRRLRAEREMWSVEVPLSAGTGRITLPTHMSERDARVLRMTLEHVVAVAEMGAEGPGPGDGEVGS